MEDRFARHIEDLHRQLDGWAAKGNRLACRQVITCATCPARDAWLVGKDASIFEWLDQRRELENDWGGTSLYRITDSWLRKLERLQQRVEVVTDRPEGDALKLCRDDHRPTCRQQMASCLASCPALEDCEAAIMRLEALFRDQCRGWYSSMPEADRAQHGRQRVFRLDADHAALAATVEISEQRENARALVEALEKALSPAQELCVARYYWNQDTQAEIARTLGISQQAVSRHLERARAAIEKFGAEVVKQALSSTKYEGGRWAYRNDPPDPGPVAHARLKTVFEVKSVGTYPMDLARHTFERAGWTERGVWRAWYTDKLAQYTDAALPLDFMPKGKERDRLAAAVAPNQQGKQPRTVISAGEYLEHHCDVHKPGDRSRFITGPLIKREVTFIRYLHLETDERKHLSPTAWRDARPKRTRRRFVPGGLREASFFGK